ncbi:MAG: ATP-binding protein, partial [Pseudomonadota bacterium]
SSFTTQTIYELRDTIWAMNKTQITFEDLQSRITNFINNAKSATSKTEFTFEIDKDLNQKIIFTSVQGMNIYRIIQEAVNNSIKYAKASEVKVMISENNGFHIEITDDGIGFAEDQVALGNGINNMKKRTRDLNGSFAISSSVKKGTAIKVIIPEKAI